MRSKSMRHALTAIAGIVCCAGVTMVHPVPSVAYEPQTADDLVAKNIEAKGGLAKIKAIKSLRMTGRLQQGDFTAVVGQEARAPDLLRLTFTVQNMTQVQAYDGSVGWQISPFSGRKDPELLGEDDMRDLVEQ